MLLTDFCNRLTIRAPANRSITERATCVALTPQALPLAGPGAETPNADERSSCVAPDHLATIRPRSASRLTARDQLQPVAALCFASSPLEERSVGAPFHGCPPHRSVVFSDAAARPTSDVPCHPRRSRFPEIIDGIAPVELDQRDCSRRATTKTRTASIVRASRRTTWFGPRRLPSTGAPWRALSRPPFPIWWRARHRTRRFATDGPASGAISPRERSRAPRLDRPPLSTRSSRMGGSGLAPPVDFCNRCDPRARPRRPNSAAPHRRSPAGAAVLPAFLVLGVCTPNPSELGACAPNPSSS